jgi:hypothetical protein
MGICDLSLIFLGNRSGVVFTRAANQFQLLSVSLKSERIDLRPVYQRITSHIRIAQIYQDVGRNEAF